MRENIICGISIYFLADKAVMPTEANIPSGFTISTEPVQVFDYRDKDAFLDALWEALQEGNPSVDDPPASEVTKNENGFPVFKNPMELKYAGVSTWDDLERASIYASICQYPSGFGIDIFGRAADGTWGEDIVFNAKVPVDDGIGAVVDAILGHLQTRADMPAAGPL